MTDRDADTLIHPNGLVVRCEGREYVIPSHFRGLFAIGRGPQCEIVLDSQVVSRLHGCIRATGSGFSYRDMSSNGTILLDGHDEKLLHDDEVSLPDQGALRIHDYLLAFRRQPG